MKSKQTIRDLAADLKSKGYSTGETARILDVSRRTIQRWNKEAGPPVVQTSRPERRKLSALQEQAVLEFIQGKPGTFQDEIVDFAAKNWDVSISVRTASRILRRNNYTRKRGTRVNNRFSVIRSMQFLVELRELYSATQAPFASIDEMSVMLNLAPSYGYVD